LGNESTTDSSTPQTVTSSSTAITGVQKIATGDLHTCAIINGGAKCWGSNTYGQLGTGNNDDASSPQTIPGLTTGVQDIVAGTGFTCAIVNHGLKCWGRNHLGQLGNNDAPNNSSSPVNVRDAALAAIISGAESISLGVDHACATVNGAALCWGNNSSGQLGDGTISNAPTARAIPTLTSNIQSIFAGGTHSCALTDGILYCWGNNSSGQLAINSTTSSLVPIPIIGF
jgi:alpha-tubulin suppressor-like RCC1 family protein